MNCEDDLSFEKVDRSRFTIEDKWILSRLNTVITEVTANLDRFEFGIAVAKIYSFLWEEYCDWYIEIAKARLYDKESSTRLEAQFILNDVLARSMQLLHPFMPFLTEEVYSYLVLDHRAESIMISDWPKPDVSDEYPVQEQQMVLLMDAIRAIRNVRVNMGVAPSRKANIILVTDDSTVADMFVTGKGFLERLASVSGLEVKDNKDNIPSTAVAAVFGGGEIYIPLEDLIDIEKELDRLDKEMINLKRELERVEGKLSNEEFVGKAPEKVIIAEREKQVRYQEMYKNILARIELLK